MWVFGFKSERAPLVWEVTGSTRLEILGGTFGVAHPDTYLLNDGCAVTLVANSSGFRIQGDEKVIVQRRRGGQKTVLANKLPSRPDGHSNVFIPLYVSQP